MSVEFHKEMEEGEYKLEIFLNSSDGIHTYQYIGRPVVILVTNKVNRLTVKLVKRSQLSLEPIEITPCKSESANLKEYMHRKRLKNKDLAKALGRDPGTISKYVNGTMPVPYKYQDKLCELLGISKQELRNCTMLQDAQSK